MFVFGILAAILTAIYSMKIIMLVFHGKTRLAKDIFEHAHEPPKVMNNPLTLLVAGSFGSGMIGYYMLSMDKPNGYFHDSLLNLQAYKLLITHPPLHIKLLPMIVGIIGIIAGICLYKYSLSSRGLSTGFSKKYKNECLYVGFIKVLTNKYYFDELYNFLIVKPINCLACLFDSNDQKIIDRFGPNGFARSVNCFSRLTSKIQTGYVFHYTLYIVFFMVAVISCFVWLGVGL